MLSIDDFARQPKLYFLVVKTLLIANIKYILNRVLYRTRVK